MPVQIQYILRQSDTSLKVCYIWYTLWVFYTCADVWAYVFPSTASPALPARLSSVRETANVAKK